MPSGEKSITPTSTAPKTASSKVPKYPRSDRNPSTALGFLSLRGYLGTLDDAVFGAVLVAVMLFAPEGILRLDARRSIAALVARLRGPERTP